MSNKELLESLDIKVDSIKKIGKVTIINDKYVIKAIDDINFYEYLITRKFNYFPKLYSVPINNIEMTDYIDDKAIPEAQRLEDMIYITSLLHLNTSFDKVLDIDNIKEIYETTIDKLTELSNYYLELQNLIEEEVYMSPANYLLIRNISLVYQAINLAREYIEKWYKEVEKKESIRYAYIHGNLRKSHLLEDDSFYLISWNQSKIAFPTKDIEILYRNSYLDISLKDILNIYEVKYPLKKEEKYFLYANILIPEKVDFNMDEYPKTKAVSNLILYLEDTLSYLEDNSKKTNNNTNK